MRGWSSSPEIRPDPTNIERTAVAHNADRTAAEPELHHAEDRGGRRVPGGGGGRERRARVELVRTARAPLRGVVEGGARAVPLQLRLPRGGRRGPQPDDQPDAAGGLLRRARGAPAAELPQVRPPQRRPRGLGVEL